MYVTLESLERITHFEMRGTRGANAMIFLLCLGQILHPYWFPNRNLDTASGDKWWCPSQPGIVTFALHTKENTLYGSNIAGRKIHSRWLVVICAHFQMLRRITSDYKEDGLLLVAVTLINDETVFNHHSPEWTIVSHTNHFISQNWLVLITHPKDISQPTNHPFSRLQRVHGPTNHPKSWGK